MNRTEPVFDVLHVMCSCSVTKSPRPVFHLSYSHQTRSGDGANVTSYYQGTCPDCYGFHRHERTFPAVAT